jgi:hypothetical protein
MEPAARIERATSRVRAGRTPSVLRWRVTSRVLLLEPTARIELAPAAYKAAAQPSCYAGDVPPAGFEPALSVSSRPRLLPLGYEGVNVTVPGRVDTTSGYGESNPGIHHGRVAHFRCATTACCTIR